MWRVMQGGGRHGRDTERGVSGSGLFMDTALGMKRPRGTAPNITFSLEK